jgi:hypothetical protein
MTALVEHAASPVSLPHIELVDVSDMIVSENGQPSHDLVRGG